MLDSEVLEEINSTYMENKKLPEIMKDLNQDVNITYWAGKFCTQEYYENIDLAEILFEYSLEKCETWRDYKELAFAVGNSSGFDDKEWARELIDKATQKVEILRDLRSLADAIATENLSFYDRGYATELYKEALEKSTTAYEFYCIAESLCNKAMLDDKDWAIDVYQKAVECAADSDELTYIADSIADEENLADEEWAQELYKIAEEFEGTKELD